MKGLRQLISRFFIPTTVAAALILIGGACEKIHEFPEKGREVDPTQVSMEIKVKLNLTLEVGEVVTKAAKPLVPEEEIDSKYDRRYFVEIRSAEYVDTLVESFLITREASDTSALVIRTDLHTRKYNVYMWTDFVLKGTTEDLYYDTGNGLALDAIHLLPRSLYVAGTDYKSTQYATAPLDLTPYAGEWFIELTIPVQLESPMAKITFLASDLAEYAQTAGITMSLSDLAKQMEDAFSYSGYLPTGFNLYTGRLNDSEVGYGFDHVARHPCVFRENEYTLVGSDYVFVNGEQSSVTVAVKICNKEGKIINQLGGIAVPIYRGKETIVIYKFFTKEYTPGIGIDPGFDGEFDIYV